MKIIKKTFIILIFVTYLFVFNRQLPSEITYIPLWTENLQMVDVFARASEESPEAFRLNGKFGYLYPNGKITFLEDLLYGVAADEYGFISYSKQNDVLVNRDINGQFLNVVELPGYPIFSGGRKLRKINSGDAVSELISEIEKIIGGEK